MKGLERTLGLKYVVAISIGAMLGSGIFVLPGVAAAKTGPSVWLAYLFAGISVFPAAVSKSELATAMPTSGGAYVFLDRAFGPLVGTISGLSLWASLLLKSSFALVGFSAYLQAMGVEIAMRPTALTLLVLITAINILGVRSVGKVVLVVVAIALASLVGLVAAGVLFEELPPPERFFSDGPGGFVSAAAFVCVAYAGVTKVSAVAGEVRNPDRNLPRGMILSLTLITFIYTTVVLVMVELIPLDVIGHDLAPVFTVAKHIGGPTLGATFAVIGVLTMASMSNAGLLASSRFPYAMARDRLLPPAFTRVHAHLRTPVVSILVTSATMAFAILWLDVERIAKLASGLVILMFVLNNAAVIVFREGRASWYRPAYRSPAYPALQVFGIAVGLLFLVAMGFVVLVGIVAVALPGTLLYVAYGRRRTVRRGVMSQMGARPELLGAHQGAEPSPPRGAAVTVALFGLERSPEVLVEMAVAIANGRPVEVVHLTETPVDVPVEELLEEDPALRSLRRRIGALAEVTRSEVHFEAVVCRDLVKTAYEFTTRLQCRWLVVPWRGRQGRNRLLFLSPLGWLEHHMAANLAQFRDVGVRYIRKILVYPEPGPDDGLVVRTADRVARVEGARLVFVRFVPSAAGTDAVREDAERAYLDGLRFVCSQPTEQLLLHGDDEVETVVEATAACDLLITGAAAPPRGRDRLRGTAKDRIMERAACSVLSLKTPPGSTHADPFEFTAEPVQEVAGGLDLGSAIDARCVAARIAAPDRSALFAELAARLAASESRAAAADFELALNERENAQNTAVGFGVAIPHATIVSVDRAFAGLVTLETPLDYGAADGTPVDVVFVTVGPPAARVTHLQMMATLAGLILRPGVLAALRAARNDAALLEALESAVASHSADRDAVASVSGNT